MESSQNPQSSAEHMEATTPAVNDAVSQPTLNLNPLAQKQLVYLTEKFKEAGNRPDSYQIQDEGEMASFALVFTALVVANPMASQKAAEFLQSAMALIKSDAPEVEIMRRMLMLDKSSSEAEIKQSLEGVLELMRTLRSDFGHRRTRAPGFGFPGMSIYDVFGSFIQP